MKYFKESTIYLAVVSVQQKLRYGNRTPVMLPYLQWIVLFYHNNCLSHLKKCAAAAAAN